jgi:hypothetical protein
VIQPEDFTETARYFERKKARDSSLAWCIWGGAIGHNGLMAPKAKTPAPRKPMSSGHKAALARGRAESATVRHYLEALETTKPKRGRKRTPASIDKRLATIESQLADADALTRLHLLQEQKDLLDERSRVDQVKDLTALEKQFIKVAKAYGERKGITYGTWRAAGVGAAVLQKAEISRARS